MREFFIPFVLFVGTHMAFLMIALQLYADAP
jgi:hypothetical protein